VIRRLQMDRGERFAPTRLQTADRIFFAVDTTQTV
jgi:hypothetical protein